MEVPVESDHGAGYLLPPEVEVGRAAYTGLPVTVDSIEGLRPHFQLDTART